MAYVFPPTGYVTDYGTLVLHNDSTRFASSTVKRSLKAIDQTVQLPDGRIIDLAAGESTIWVPIDFTQRYVITSGGAAWMRTIGWYIDNNNEDTITLEGADGAFTYTATGRMIECVEVSSIQPNDGASIEIECTFKASSDWV